jgi:hypothetical protein
MFFHTLAYTALIVAAASPLTAQLAPRTPAPVTPQAPPPPKLLDFDESMKKLEQLEQISRTLDEQKYGYNAKIIRELREAGVTSDKSFALWLDCMKSVEFDQKGKTMTEYSEWKRGQTKDANRDRDAEFQIQVQWLAIVLMDANAKTESARGEAVAAAVMFLDNFVAQAQKADGKIGGAARQSVMDSVFARHYKLESSVIRRDGVAYTPGDIDGIYEKMILPYYRETKQAVNLMSAWKKRIEQQTAVAVSPRYKEAKEKFEEERLPELRWGQAVELFRLGQEEPAATAMLSLIKSNMAHRNAANWISEMKTLLSKPAKPAAGEPPAGAGETPAAPAEPPAPVAPADGVPSAPQPETPAVELEPVDNPFGGESTAPTTTTSISLCQKPRLPVGDWGGEPLSRACGTLVGVRAALFRWC